MLPCPPASIELRNFNTCEHEIGDGTYACIVHTSFYKSDEVVETEASSGGDDVRKNTGLVSMNLNKLSISEAGNIA